MRFREVVCPDREVSRSRVTIVWAVSSLSREVSRSRVSKHNCAWTRVSRHLRPGICGLELWSYGAVYSITSRRPQWDRFGGTLYRGWVVFQIVVGRVSPTFNGTNVDK